MTRVPPKRATAMTAAEYRSARAAICRPASTSAAETAVLMAKLRRAHPDLAARADAEILIDLNKELSTR